MPRGKIALATDGCGVVTFGIPLRGLALAFARLADPSEVKDPALRTALERIRDAMMAHPELVGGERRNLDTSLMRAAPGALVSKGGAEGVQAVAILGGEATRAGHQGRGRGRGPPRAQREHGGRSASLRRIGPGDHRRTPGRVRGYHPIRDLRGAPSGAVRAAFALA